MALEKLSQHARAVEENWCAAWMTLGALAAQPATHVDETAQFVRVYTPGAPEMLLNIVMLYASRRSVERDDIERVIALFRTHRLPFQWWLTLGQEPAGLRDQLYGLGMQSFGGATSMTLPLDDAWLPQFPSPASGTRLMRLSTARELREALDVICDVFYVPSAPMARWTCDNPAFDLYGAERQGRIVAALATLRIGRVVGVYHVATDIHARRRGLAGNLLLLALRDARESGCALATLTATPEARHLYEQLGFKTCGTIEQWVPGPELGLALASGRRELPVHTPFSW
jgi:ribosomal protein S18 acetylase RimI-like enzyme